MSPAEPFVLPASTCPGPASTSAAVAQSVNGRMRIRTASLLSSLARSRRRRESGGHLPTDVVPARTLPETDLGEDEKTLISRLTRAIGSNEQRRSDPHGPG